MSSKRKFSSKHVVSLFFLYWAIAVAITALATFWIEALMRPTIMILIGAGTLVFAAVMTVVHVRKGKREPIDDIADRL